MKVKNEGINSQTWRMDLICPCCEAKLEISYGDLCLCSKTSFFDRKKFWFETNCCECNETIEISTKEIPNCLKKEMIRNMSPSEFLITFYF